MIRLLTAVLVILSLSEVRAQSTVNGWFFSSHKQSISTKWRVTSDIQFRSADKFTRLETVLLRPGISYSISEQHSVTLGYAYLYNKSVENETAGYEYENRIWEQYNFESKIGRTELTNRIRLEQRFLNADTRAFSQRFRYYLRAQIPLLTNAAFTKGLYGGLQNELFLNVQNKQEVNNSFFDQNRAGLSAGYRFSEKVDLELAYIYRYQVEIGAKNHNNIIQLAAYTTL